MNLFILERTVSTGDNTMEKDEKKEYEKPMLIQHENLNEVTKGDAYSNPQP